MYYNSLYTLTISTSEINEMTSSKIPILQFNTAKAQDIPYEIFRIEENISNDHVPTIFRQAFYLIVVITAGTGTNQVDFKTYPIKQGTVYFITPGQIQRWEVEQSLSGYVILFEEGFLPTSSFDSVTPRSFDFFHRTDLAPLLYLENELYELTHLCEEMLRAYTTEGFGRSDLLQSYLRIFLIRSQRYYMEQRGVERNSGGGTLIEKYIRLIDLHYLQKQRVGEYAEMLGVTAGYLTDTTRSKLGLRAGQLIQRRVILEAQRLLSYSGQSIGEIAFTLNFTDPSYFARYFRRETGLSPTAFRFNIRKKYPNHRLKS